MNLTPEEQDFIKRIQSRSTSTPQITQEHGLDLTFGNPTLQGIGNTIKSVLPSRLPYYGVTNQQSDSALDTAIKYNQLQTGTPEFKREEAQIRANMELQSQLDADEAKKKRAREDYKAALDARGNGQQSMQPMPQAGPTLPTAMPSRGGEVPQYIPFTTPGKYDPTLGTFGPDEIDYKENKEYIKPEDREAKQKEVDMIIESANQTLSAIGEAKKRKQYFGPYGNIPSIYAPESMLGLNQSAYGDRKMWENNVNQILKKKVVDLITQMKSASKTGATGFGNLSDAEGRLLQEASTAFSKDLPGDQAVKYLEDMERLTRKVLGNTQTNSNYDSDKEARYQAWKASQNATA